VIAAAGEEEITLHPALVTAEDRGERTAHKTRIARLHEEISTGPNLCDAKRENPRANWN
jgi:hypothetical protein